MLVYESISAQAIPLTRDTEGVEMPVPKPDPQSAERRSLRQIAVEKIKHAIIDGTLLPGEDLNDVELQTWLGMSRTPVREALTELTRLGLVETEAQRYTRVANPDPATAFYDLQTVGALLGGVTRVTVPALTDTALENLVATIDHALAALHADDRGTFWNHALRVSQQLRADCPNPVLLDATSDMVDAKIHLISLSGLIHNADIDRLTRNYQSLRDAVATRNPIDAELAVERIFLLDQPLPQA